MDDRVKQLRFTRRQFIRTAGVVGAGAGLTAACATLTTPTPAASSSNMGNMNTAPVAQTVPDYKAIDAAHEARVKIFLDNIGKDSNFWGVELPFVMDGDTKVFDLVAKNVDWEIEPGKVIKGAYTYNGIVPGPIIRITEGDKIRVN